MATWKRFDIWAVTALLLFLCTSAAKSSGNESGHHGSLNVVTPNQAVNNQSASGSVNQSPVGGINNNTQINNSQSTDYGFAPGIFCRSPSFSLGAYGGSSNNDGYYSSLNSASYGAVVALNIPLPTETDSLCRALAREIVLQRQLDTSLNIVKQCALLSKEGIIFDPQVFPEFERCRGVKLAKDALQHPLARPQSVFEPRDKPVITVPVR